MGAFLDTHLFEPGQGSFQIGAAGNTSGGINHPLGRIGNQDFRTGGFVRPRYDNIAFKHAGQPLRGQLQLPFRLALDRR